MNVTAQLMGDPPFERSALGQRVNAERMKRIEITPIRDIAPVPRSRAFAKHQDEIRRQWLDGVPQRRICKAFGIHSSTLVNAALEEGWPLR